MDRIRNSSQTDAISCPYCRARSRALLGLSGSGRQHRHKCRKCDAEYWENEALGMVQQEIDDDSLNV